MQTTTRQKAALLRQNDRFARGAVRLVPSLSREDAEELYNDALLNMSAAIDAYDPAIGYTLEALIRRYIGGMLANGGRLGETIKADAIKSTASTDDDSAPELGDPRHESESIDARIMLDKAVETCQTPRQRQALQLLREGCTYTQIASELGIGQGGATALCRRAVKAARGRILAEGVR